ncbi:MAG: hypothetical protein IPM16_10495 [Chloroflexi bacterium]|nr:hypothetical protein [Chloroflexota bacterium]
MSKSGLADSPLFTRTDQPQAVRLVQQQVGERSVDRSNERPVERPNDPSPEVQIHTPSRPYHRYSFDIYDDQVAAIDELVFRRRQKGKRMTKGEVMRELLDRALQSTE